MDKFENIFRDKLENFESTPPSGLFFQISKEINKKPLQRRNAFLWIASRAAVILLFSAISFQLAFEPLNINGNVFSEIIVSEEKDSLPIKNEIQNILETEVKEKDLRNVSSSKSNPKIQETIVKRAKLDCKTVESKSFVGHFPTNLDQNKKLKTVNLISENNNEKNAKMASSAHKLTNNKTNNSNPHDLKSYLLSKLEEGENISMAFQNPETQNDHRKRFKIRIKDFEFNGSFKNN